MADENQQSAQASGDAAALGDAAATQKLPVASQGAASDTSQPPQGASSKTSQVPQGVAPNPSQVPQGTSSGTSQVSRGVAPGLAPATSEDVPAKNADPVEALRAAHGLSPKSKTKEEAAEARRRDKEAVAEERRQKAKQQHRAKVVRNVLLVILLVVVIGVIVAFCLLRWGLHDDAASIQGKWRVQGTDTVIEVTDEDIVLTDEVAYDYVLDPESKTLAFTFGGLTGGGRYRFSLDHSMLSIDDGEYDFWETLAQDIPWTFEAISQELVGAPDKSPAFGTSDMVLERIG